MYTLYIYTISTIDYKYNIILLTKRSRVLHFKSVTSKKILIARHININETWMFLFHQMSFLPSFLPPSKKKQDPPVSTGKNPLSEATVSKRWVPEIGLLHHPFDFVGPFASAELLPGGFFGGPQTDRYKWSFMYTGKPYKWSKIDP